MAAGYLIPGNLSIKTSIRQGANLACLNTLINAQFDRDGRFLPGSQLTIFPTGNGLPPFSIRSNNALATACVVTVSADGRKAVVIGQGDDISRPYADGTFPRVSFALLYTIGNGIFKPLPYGTMAARILWPDGTKFDTTDYPKEVEIYSGAVQIRKVI